MKTRTISHERVSNVRVFICTFVSEFVSECAGYGVVLKHDAAVAGAVPAVVCVPCAVHFYILYVIDL